MHKIALLTLLLAVCYVAAIAQEDETDASADAVVDAVANQAGETSGATDDSEQPSEPDAAESPAEVDDELLDEDEYYQDIDDEDFRPSEDIPADQSIPFPADI